MPASPNVVKWTKIINWRANGDGINPGSNTRIEDCFLRTQDDSLCTTGLGISRVVLWNDANGSSYFISGIDKLKDTTFLVKDCDVIYSRSMNSKNGWTGARVFNMRGTTAPEPTAKVIFRNITVEDPRPTLQ